LIPQKSLLGIAPNSTKLRLKPTAKTEKNTEQKSYKNMMKHRGHEEDLGLLSHSKTQKIYHEFFSSWDLSQEHKS
jgi:hypothetical protein